MIGARHYRIALPVGHDGTDDVGAVVWAHGYRGTAAGVMQNNSLRRMVSGAGLALIAVKSGDGGWDIPGAPRGMHSSGASEFAYFEAVLDDAANRHGIDRSRVIAAGFSAGGMMVWNLACARPDLFAGFVPIAGTFWQAPPHTCAAPTASIVHIHGNADGTVPLEGRAIGPTRQGDVSAALAMYSAFGGFGPATARRNDDLTCENKVNPGGAILEFCLFPGGHSFRTEYLRYGLDRLRAAGRL
tara:strand:+ start:97080 stop:97808 length:729 start_codon:yes stop_codon:yes gene_type:complete